MTNELKSLLASEIGCAPALLDKPGINLMKNNNTQTSFLCPTPGLLAISCGIGVVVSSNEAYYSILSDAYIESSRDDFFEVNNLGFLESIVRGDDLMLTGPYIALIGPPNLKKIVPQANSELQVDILHTDIPRLYNHEGFGNALQYDSDCVNPDSLAVTVSYRDKVIAIAAASAEHSEFWSVGIEVLPKWRNQGIGKQALAVLTEAIYDTGHIPYYCINVSNLPSLNLALSVGYRLGWTMIYTV